MRISMDVLILLYKEAKHALIAANRQYKELNITKNICWVEKFVCISVSLDDSIESEIMKHNRVACY